MTGDAAPAQLTVPAASAGERLDVFAAGHLSGVSRSKIQKLIEEGLIRLNGIAVRKNARVKPGDAVRIDAGACGIAAPPPLAQDIPLDIIYEDDYLLAVNKPAGMVVHPGSGNRQATLVNALLHRCAALSGGYETDRPGIVHRLDKDTSGVLLVAKTDAAHAALGRMFSERKIIKHYLGICAGQRPLEHGSIELALGRSRREPLKRSVRIDGKNAVTEYWLLAHRSGVSVMRFRPHTGRTHQIRVHCRSFGFPILCDQVYGGGRDRIELLPPLERPFAFRIYKCFRRHALHAYSLVFTHPITNCALRLIAPLPDDFSEALMLMGAGNVEERI